MARNRMLNPEFWLDEDVAKLSAHARLLYMGLWGICDDNYATFPNRPEWLKAQVFPYEGVDMGSLLKELEQAEKIIRFTIENKEFFYLKNFFKYQKIDRPSAPKYPEYTTTQQPLGEDSTSTRSEVKLKEDKLKEDKVSKDSMLTHFEKFWAEYPNKTSKKKASEKWLNLFKALTTAEADKLFSEVIVGLERAKKSSQWQKDNGQYIPHPTTWLNQERWKDEGVRQTFATGGSSDKFKNVGKKI